MARGRNASPLASDGKVDEQVDKHVDHESLQKCEEEAWTCPSNWCGLHYYGCWQKRLMGLLWEPVPMRSWNNDNTRRTMWCVWRAAVGWLRLTSALDWVMRWARRCWWCAASGALTKRGLVGWDGLVREHPHIVLTCIRLCGGRRRLLTCGHSWTDDEW